MLFCFVFFFGGGYFYFILFIFFGGGGLIEESDYFWASSLCILGTFLKVKVRNGKIFLGC